MVVSISNISFFSRQGIGHPSFECATNFMGRHIIKEIKTQELSILLVEQDYSFAIKLADYVYVMSRGIIVYESEPEKLKENPEIRSRYLGV